MPINIFQVDPDAAAKPRRKLDVVGRFRSGTQLNGRPVALSEWRVTTGDPVVADRIADLYGGTPEEWKGTKTEEKIEVFTEQSSVVILVGPGQLRSELALWSRQNKKIRTCDGVVQSDGSDCVCPQTLEDRKIAEKEGTGCSPQVTVFFRLSADPSLGVFKFQSQAWGLVRKLPAITEELDAALQLNDLAVVRMSLEKVEFTTKSGEARKYTESQFNVIGSTGEPD